MKVLVVDENPRIRDLVRLLLEEAGLEVTPAGCYAEAQKQLGARPFDVVVSELQEGWEKQAEFARLVAGDSRPSLILHTAWPAVVRTPLDPVAGSRVVKRSDFSPLLDALRAVERRRRPRSSGRTVPRRGR